MSVQMSVQMIVHTRTVHVTLPQVKNTEYKSFLRSSVRSTFHFNLWQISVRKSEYYLKFFEKHSASLQLMHYSNN